MAKWVYISGLTGIKRGKGLEKRRKWLLFAEESICIVMEQQKVNKPKRRLRAPMLPIPDGNGGYITPERKDIDYEYVGNVVSMNVIMDAYEMAKLDVEKTEQAFDRLSSKSSVLMGLMTTVMLALISAFAACLVRNPEDLTTLICSAAALLSTGICIFMLSFGVLSDKSIYTTGETANLYLNDEGVDRYESHPEEIRDGVYFAMKAEDLRFRSENNMDMLTSMAKWYRLSIRLFVCLIAVIGIIYMISQICQQV